MSLLHNLGQTKIRYFRITVLVKEYVGWFQVIMNDGLIVYNGSSIKSGGEGVRGCVVRVSNCIIRGCVH